MNSKPVAILVKKNQFKDKKSNIKISNGILRSNFISILLNLIKKKLKLFLRLDLRQGSFFN